MILRTPPPKRPRPDATATDGDGRHQQQRLVIYEDPPSGPLTQQLESSPHHLTTTPESSSSSHMLCTYQCRQLVKSEFIDALNNAEKQVRDYETKFEVLNNNLSTAETERKKYKDKLLYVEQELAAAKGREHALQEQLLKEINDSQERLKKQLESNSTLEVRLENERNLRLKAESSAASAEDKASVLEGKLNNLSQSIEREKICLGNELEELKRESKLSVSRIGADLERMECRARSAEKESELLKEQLEDMKVKLSEFLHQKSELEKKVSSFQFQEVSSTENNILVKHLQEELRNYESEVREARKSKSSHENIELLKEKLLEEKGRRERAESQLPKLQEFELRAKVLEDELSSWKLLMKEIPGVASSDDIPIKFAALQKEVIDNMMKLGNANAQLKQMEVALDAAQLSKEKAEMEFALSKEKVESLELELKQIGSMLSSVTEERERLKSVVTELRRGQVGDDSHGGTIFQDLESSLAKKESYIEQLENNLKVQKEINKRQFDEITLLNEKLNNEARRIKSLERESDRLRSEISLLESKLGHGDFSAANTKVLRMVNTLAVDNEAKQTIETLQTELQKAKEKLQALEELKSHPGDAGKLVDISGKITQLKDQIATLEKREERYKTVFADRITVFRRACCELFGYKIVMDEHQRPNGIPVTRFTLQSIYAQSDDEKLEFEYESGNTNIMANDYTSQPEISRQVDIFVRKMSSIPAFTANLTVESFNRRTLS